MRPKYIYLATTTSGDEIWVLPFLKMYRELHSDIYIDLDVKGTVYLVAVSFPLGGALRAGSKIDNRMRVDHFSTITTCVFPLLCTGCFCR